MEEALGRNKTTVYENVPLIYLIVLAGAGVLYVLTCAPTVLWQDSGLLIYRIWHNDLQGDLGLAISHPLYILVGIAVKHIPIGQLAYKVNLISAVFGAVTAANLFLLLRLWLGRNLPAVIGAITLAVSWTFWQNAVIAEVYSMYAAQMSAELIMLLQYVRTKRIGYLYLLGLFNGLAIANHMWGSLALICYAAFFIVLLARKQIRLKHCGIVILLWIIGAIPYEYLIIKNIIISGDVAGTLASAMFGNIWQNRVLNTSVSMKIVLENIIFILLNFPTPNLLLLLLGLWVIRKKAPSRSFANIIIAMTILYFVFAFRYTVPDRHAFFLPFYCLAAIIIGLGADTLLKRYNYKSLALIVLAFTLLPIPTYFITPAVARTFYKPLGQRRQRPYRDEYTYWLQPWKTGYRGAERFANEALDGVENNAIIYAYTTDVHALLYAQEVNGKRPDVKIVSNFDSGENAPAFNENTVADLMANSALYVVSPAKRYCPPFLIENYDFIESGILWRVVGKTDTTEKK